ncbi:hypothetical protein GCM10010278_84900 [Streptomyces melanogenes]|nr:hypothetical protein GCM10010278_84900 [Streptomyces melanogenes]
MTKEIGAPEPRGAGAVRCGVDDAEAVAFGIGERDEVGVVRVEVPVDACSAQGNQPCHLGFLIGGVACIEVEVDPPEVLPPSWDRDRPYGPVSG